MTPSGLPVVSTEVERKVRAKRILSSLKKMYPIPKTELHYSTPFQLLAAVMMSAQCTDKKVNAVTDILYKKYKTPKDFSKLDPDALASELSSITYYKTKARNVIGAATLIEQNFDGVVPKTEAELVTLPGIAYKSAHVILGELHNTWEGIPTDTHVRRFALRFDLTEHTQLLQISKDLERLIPKSDWKYVNNGLVLYGRYVCPARPHACEDHPLTKLWPPVAHRWPKSK